MGGTNVEFLSAVTAGAAEAKAIRPARIAVLLMMGCGA
jgi:hypothetical protein